MTQNEFKEKLHSKVSDKLLVILIERQMDRARGNGVNAVSPFSPNRERVAPLFLELSERYKNKVYANNTRRRNNKRIVEGRED